MRLISHTSYMTQNSKIANEEFHMNHKKVFKSTNPRTLPSSANKM